MSTLHIPDDVLKQAGITEKEALLELACGLFDTGKLTLFFAAKLAGLEPAELESVLLDRKIPVYRYDTGDLKKDLETFGRGKT